MKDKSNKLDDIIREKMSELGSSYRPETWDWLSDRLDALEETTDPMDDIIRQKLSGLGTAYRPETWDWLSERLDDLADEGAPAGAEMQAMDEAIYERMHRFEKPYDPNHWPMLLKKLEANAMVGKRIIHYKAMELSLLALILLTFVRLPLSTDRAPQHLYETPELPRPQAGIEKSDLNTSENSNEQAIAADLSSSKAATINGIINGNPLSDSPAGEADNRQIAQLDATANPPRQEADVTGAAPAVITAPEAISGLNNLNQLPSKMQDLALPETKKPATAIFDQSIVKAESSILGVNPANALGILAYLPGTMVRPLCITCVGKMDQKAKAAREQTFIRVGMFGGPDYNRVITPQTTIKGEDYQADRYSLGYSAGLTFGLEKNRWEIETGLIYSNKKYFPLPVLVLDGSVGEGLIGDGTKQFDLDIFQIPLNFRYSFFRKDRWRIYALAGMSLHVTGQSNYYLANAEGFESPTFRPQPTDPNQGGIGRNAPTVKSLFDNFTKGWLEGGDFSKNSFMSANVGVGIEWFVTDFWSIYAQPTYNHSLLYPNDGLGPYYDRIHTNSIRIGLKARLK
jgi:hypothetical protein